MQSECYLESMTDSKKSKMSVSVQEQDIFFDTALTLVKKAGAVSLLID